MWPYLLAWSSLSRAIDVQFHAGAMESPAGIALCPTAMALAALLKRSLCGGSCDGFTKMVVAGCCVRRNAWSINLRLAPRAKSMVGQLG